MSLDEKLLFVYFSASSSFFFKFPNLLEWRSFSCISYHNFKFQYRTVLISALYCACAPKNWSFQTIVLEKTLESPLDRKIKSVNPKGNQFWLFIGRTVAEAEVLTLWPPDGKRWRPWCWERLRAGGGGDREWDGWMASLIQWTWVWASSRGGG